MIEHFDRVSVAGARDSMAELQPFEFGWFGYFTHSLKSRATRTREMEYAWSKALAYGAAMSLETNKKALDSNGRTREIFGLIKRWEDLKLKNSVPAGIREQLKAPGKEFALEGERILPVEYSPEVYGAGADEWIFDNPYGAQPARFSVDAMPSLAKFHEAANVVILDPARPLKMYTEGTGPLGSPARQSEGVRYELKAAGEDFQVSAVNSGQDPAGWGCAEIILDGGPKDLSGHRALGVWVEGDGSGAVLHFTLEDSGRWNVRDYYVRLNFKGRRYVEIPEAAKGEVYDFAFPYSNYWPIREINYRSIARVYVFLTNIAPGRTVESRFGRVEALKETPLPLVNPTLRINGRRVVFPVRLETDWYLEYSGAGKARIFDANGFTKAEVAPAGPVPQLRRGANRIAFEYRGIPAKITANARGQALEQESEERR
ncbi:MAG: hypothetical protein M1541_06745 [Acidobacteria bacterium]|nr:hypothetical protein [Acidobacteriota bacterium]